MQKDTRGIATTYRGINFRSRLEATWAAFFDAYGLRWEYEPCVFEGPGWTPDFLLVDSGILCECKPVPEVEQWRDHECLPYIRERIADDQRVLLIGLLPLAIWFGEGLGSERLDSRAIGLLTSRQQSPWGVAGAFLSVSGTVQSLCGEVVVVDRPFKVDDLGLALKLSYASRVADEAWAKAKNAVQWRPGE